MAFVASKARADPFFQHRSFRHSTPWPKRSIRLRRRFGGWNDFMVLSLGQGNGLPVVAQHVE
jgi:hypothetical protein